MSGGVCSEAGRGKKNNLSPSVFCEKGTVQMRKKGLSSREAEGLEILSTNCDSMQWSRREAELTVFSSL